MPDYISSESPSSYDAPQFGRPPRTVRFKPKRGFSFADGFLLLINSALAIGLMIAAVHLAMTIAYGINSPAMITDERYHTHKGTPTYSVQVQFNYNGKDENAWVITSYDLYDEALARTYEPNYLASPIRTTVRFLPQTPAWDVLLVPDDGRASRQLETAIIVNLIVDACMIFVLWATLILPSINRKVLSTGTMTAGRVTRTNMNQGKTTTYSLEYAYSAEGAWGQGGSEFKGKISIPVEVFNTINESDPFTVFYDPAKPKNSYPYEPGRYEFV